MVDFNVSYMLDSLQNKEESKKLLEKYEKCLTFAFFLVTENEEELFLELYNSYSHLHSLTKEVIVIFALRPEEGKDSDYRNLEDFNSFRKNSPKEFNALRKKCTEETYELIRFIKDKSKHMDLRKNKIPLLQPLLSGFNRVIGKLFKRKSHTSDISFVDVPCVLFFNVSNPLEYVLWKLDKTSKIIEEFREIVDSIYEVKTDTLAKILNLNKKIQRQKFVSGVLKEAIIPLLPDLIKKITDLGLATATGQKTTPDV